MHEPTRLVCSQSVSDWLRDRCLYYLRWTASLTDVHVYCAWFDCFIRFQSTAAAAVPHQQSTLIVTALLHALLVILLTHSRLWVMHRCRSVTTLLAYLLGTTNWRFEQDKVYKTHPSCSLRYRTAVAGRVRWNRGSVIQLQDRPSRRWTSESVSLIDRLSTRSRPLLKVAAIRNVPGIPTGIPCG